MRIFKTLKHAFLILFFARQRQAIQKRAFNRARRPKARFVAPSKLKTRFFKTPNAEA